MGCPSITQPPDAILVAVENPDLAIDGASRTPVSVAVEGHGLDQILMPMLHDELEFSPLLQHRGISQYWRHGGLIVDIV